MAPISLQQREVPHCTWVKPGRFGSLFVLKAFVSWHLEDTVSKCFVYQNSGHTQTPRICHILVLSLLVSGSTLPRNAYFSRQTLICQIVPVLPSYLYITGAARCMGKCTECQAISGYFQAVFPYAPSGYAPFAPFRALANAALAPNSKNWKRSTQDRRQHRKINPKSLGLSAAVQE